MLTTLNTRDRASIEQWIAYLRKEKPYFDDSHPNHAGAVKAVAELYEVPRCAGRRAHRVVEISS